MYGKPEDDVSNGTGGDQDLKRPSAWGESIASMGPECRLNGQSLSLRPI